MFSFDGRAFKFRLIDLPEDVYMNIKKMILDNGGELVNTYDPLAVNFTMPDKYRPGKAMYDVNFIHDCIKSKEVKDLHKYKLGPKKEYDGCILSLFLHEHPTCMYCYSRYICNQHPQKVVCSVCGSRNTFEILDANDIPGPSQNSSYAQGVVKSETAEVAETSCNRNTVEIQDVRNLAGPSKNCSGASKEMRSRTSKNKDSDSISGVEAKRVLRLPKAEPSTSYVVVSCSDSDDDLDATTRKMDRLHSKQGNNDSDVLIVSTSDVEISSDDSEAKHHVNVINKSKVALRRSARNELHIKQEETKRPIKQETSIAEWLDLIKRKAKKIEAPRKRNFSQWERWQMLIFLIENNIIDRAKGLDVWQYLIQQNDWGQRTKWSLNNHFLKSVLPSIEEFRLPKEIEKQFIKLRNTK